MSTSACYEKCKARFHRFDISDEQDWLSHLKEQGHVTIKHAVSPKEVAAAKSGVWDWLESLGTGLDRNKKDTWRNKNWPGVAEFGFFCSQGGGQCQAAWNLRAQPRVKGSFEKIWGTSDLLTSMDTFIAWRPWLCGPESESWRPVVENIHCDQNPDRKRGFQCVQGMVVLYPVNESTGGLQVVPGSHGDEVQQYLRDEYPDAATTHTCCDSTDYLELRRSDTLSTRGQLQVAESGDLILWDSRVLHGGKVPAGTEAEQASPLADDTRLVRLSLTVCMTPRHRATPAVLAQRKAAVANGATLTHWPHEYVEHNSRDTHADITHHRYRPPILTVEQQALV